VQQVGVADKVVGAVALPPEGLLQQLSCCQREDKVHLKTGQAEMPLSKGAIEAHLKLLLKMLQEMTLQQIGLLP
jgi:hypothetical protein